MRITLLFSVHTIGLFSHIDTFLSISKLHKMGKYVFFLSYTAWISLFLFSPARFTLFSGKKPLPKRDKIFFKFFQKSACIIFQKVLYYWSRFEAWLSLVERCVRDAEVASSNLVASILACWSSGQDDALSRRKPGFDSRTGHEAVWNFHTASFFISIIVFINRKL